jgi:hypothetical protein
MYTLPLRASVTYNISISTDSAAVLHVHTHSVYSNPPKPKNEKKNGVAAGGRSREDVREQLATTNTTEQD